MAILSQPQCVNSLGPSDAIWSMSTLAQVMAWIWLPEPKLTDHWWSPLSSDIHTRTISQEMPQPSITKICLKITCLKFHENFPGANELMDNLPLFTWGEVSTSHPWHKQRLLPTLKCTGAVRGEDQLISKHKLGNTTSIKWGTGPA